MDSRMPCQCGNLSCFERLPKWVGEIAKAISVGMERPCIPISCSSTSRHEFVCNIHGYKFFLEPKRCGCCGQEIK